MVPALKGVLATCFFHDGTVASKMDIDGLRTYFDYTKFLRVVQPLIFFRSTYELFPQTLCSFSLEHPRLLEWKT